MSAALASGFFTTESPGKPCFVSIEQKIGLLMCCLN